MMPHLILISGPNGAGKSTAAPGILQGALSVSQFVNADTIALGLSAFEPERAAIQAGRVMLTRLHQLAENRRISRLKPRWPARPSRRGSGSFKKQGYHFHLIFLTLPSAELAIERVAERVRMGGHNVPTETIRRRYDAGIRNFFKRYRPLTDSWRVYDNSELLPHLIAHGSGETVECVADEPAWRRLKEFNDER